MSALQKIDEHAGATVFNALQAAIERGVDADSLGKMLDMQERILNRQAEQSYAISMTEAQAEMPKIRRNKTNQQTRSDYADLDEIIRKITPVYTSKGFSMSFGTEDSPHAGHVRVTCDVMHIQGHSRPYFVDIPLDMVGIGGKANKTEVHGTGSAISYGRRYLTMLIFNLSTGDDDDGNNAGSQYITDEQEANILALIEEVNANKEIFVNYMKTDSVSHIRAADYKKAISALEAKRSRQ